MGDKPHKPLPKLRTFQLDQAYARGESPVVSTPKVKVVQPGVKAEPIPAPKLTVTTTKKTPVAHEKIERTPSTPLPPTPPAFHELKKAAANKIEHIVAESSQPTQKTVTVRERASVPPRSFSSEAMVITSAKKAEFNFFEAVVSSFKNWVQSFSKRNASHTYTVSTLDRRKGVIQKATTNSGAIFTTDNTSIKQEITRKRNEPASETSNEIHVSWSPKTETVFTLLDEPAHPVALPARRSVIVEHKKRTLPAPEIVEPTNRTEQPPKRVFVPPPPPVQSAWESDTPAPDSPYAPAAYVPPVTPPPPVFRVPEPVPLPPTNAVAPLPTPLVSTPPAVLRFTKPGTTIPNKPNPKTSYLNRGLRQLFRFDTTLATVVTVGSIVSFVMVFLIVKTFVGMIVPVDEQDTPTISLATPLTETGEVIDVAISAPALDALKSALQNEDRPAQGVVEFRILKADGTPIAGGEAWQTFGFISNPILSRTTSEARIGYADGEMILILQVTDAVTAFGALLTWEPEMAKEFSRLFNIATDDVTTVTDQSVGSSDIRILQSGTKTVLVYGFINSNTVVVTPSLEAYKATVQN